MGVFARYSVFVLLPLLLVALFFLGQINYQAARNIGQWGERSIVESAYILAKEKVDRVEAEIISIDNMAFSVLDPSRLEQSSQNWERVLKNTLIDAALIVDDNDDVVEFFSAHHNGDTAKQHLAFIVDQIIPGTNFYDSFYQHKHYHWHIGDAYYLITTNTEEYEDQVYTTLLLYNTDEIIGRLFKDVLTDAGKGRVINVIDNNGRIVFGDALDDKGEFSVIRRFPTTLYRWKLQLTPLSSASFSRKQERAQWSKQLYVPGAFAIIVISILVLVIVWNRERRLNQLKSEFISNTSHELKTPLALIRMFSELLAMKQVASAEKVVHYHNIILRETERLTALIDNVLDFARLERGKSEYVCQLIDPCKAAASALDMYGHRIDAMGAKLVFTCDPDVPHVNLDKDAFTLVLLNLIDNAIKYATGTDIIGVEIHSSARFVYLDVYDRGPGIPPGQLKRIFERFYRYKDPASSGSGTRGSGIGLSLIKNVARAHGGNVTVSSRPKVETRFSVSFRI